MDKAQLLSTLLELANQLDSHNLHREADVLTKCMKRVAYGPYNEAGEPIMDGASWRREQNADQEYYMDLAAHGGYDESNFSKERPPTADEALEEDLWSEEEQFWSRYRMSNPQEYAELEQRGMTGGALTAAAQEGVQSGWLTKQSDWQNVYTDMVERALDGGAYEVPKDQSVYQDYGREDFGWGWGRTTNGRVI